MTRNPLFGLLGAIFVLATSCGDGRGEVPAIAEGDTAPEFTLPSVAGGEVTLSDFSGEKSVLLYFSMGPG